MSQLRLTDRVQGKVVKIQEQGQLGRATSMSDPLYQWLSIATQPLGVWSTERVKERITQAYTMSYEAAIEDGSSVSDAKECALLSLGDPMEAQERYSVSELSEDEEEELSTMLAKTQVNVAIRVLMWVLCIVVVMTIFNSLFYLIILSLFLLSFEIPYYCNSRGLIRLGYFLEFIPAHIAFYAVVFSLWRDASSFIWLCWPLIFIFKERKRYAMLKKLPRQLNRDDLISLQRTNGQNSLSNYWM